MLVIIDQHAASERIRTETLFKALCAPGAPTKRCLTKPITKFLTPKDLSRIEKHRNACERWGIAFDINQEEGTLSITALPAVAAERIDLELVEGMLLRYAVDLDEGVTLVPGAEEGEWFQQLATIPRPLKDIVNSRACRGAVMFGDVLETEECERLVRSLGESKWPFMCAHGRPSLRPLVEIEEIGRMGREKLEESGGGFRHAWGRMKKREEAQEERVRERKMSTL